MSNRREALISILKMMAVGAVAAGTSIAAVAKALDPEDQKYMTMVKLQMNAIAQWKSFGELNWRDGAHKELRDRRDASMAPTIDHLLGFAMDNFVGDTKAPEAYEATTDLFNKRLNLNTLDVDQLKQILETVVPIAVARYLLAVERICFRPAEMKNWDRFSDKYQDLILAA